MLGNGLEDELSLLYKYTDIDDGLISEVMILWVDELVNEFCILEEDHSTFDDTPLDKDGVIRDKELEDEF